MAATIQAIGRCAAAIDEVTDTCLNGLVHLLSNKEQASLLNHEFSKYIDTKDLQTSFNVVMVEASS